MEKSEQDRKKNITDFESLNKNSLKLLKLILSPTYTTLTNDDKYEMLCHKSDNCSRYYYNALLRAARLRNNGEHLMEILNFINNNLTNKQITDLLLTMDFDE
eukprot:412668_1